LPEWVPAYEQHERRLPVQEKKKGSKKGSVPNGP
jgi:hypothetical protein